jgi:starch-binding outer membrane protein, SusD/RagB family
MKNIQYLLLFAIVLLTANSCQKEYFNPSSASEDEIVKDVDGLIALCNGLQYRWSVGRQSPGYTVPVADALSTRGLKVLNAGNQDEDFLATGGNSVVASNAIITNIWTQCQLTKSTADLILRNVGNLGSAGDRAGATAYASIFRALALGTMANFFEKTTLESKESATFVDRTDALRAAVASLESAKAAYSAVSAADLANFNGKIVAGIDVPNTLNALIARYKLMLGEYSAAFDAAAAVDLTKKSEFRYDDLTRNPVYDVAFNNVNVVQPTDAALGIAAAVAPGITDGRILFYLKSVTPNSNGVYSGKGFWTANNSTVPLYLPGEMMLIKAEAKARQDLVNDAVTELNTVLTKTTDAWGIGAAQSQYSGPITKDDVLLEIYKNRRVELYMSGMTLEDCRRFNRPAPSVDGGTLNNASERSRIFYPYPNVERDNNPNTPANPSI